MQEKPDLRFVRLLAELLDGRFESGKFLFGLDVFIDLLPIGGDTVILLLSLIPIIIALRYKIPATAIGRMALTVGSVYVIGLVPVLGSLAYLLVKPNVRNYELLKKYV